MANEIRDLRLINANMFEVVSGCIPEGYDIDSYLAGNKEILEMIDNAPTIDAVPVVRCGECIRHARPLFAHPTLLWCPLIESHRKPDWYCADGKRKEVK